MKEASIGTTRTENIALTCTAIGGVLLSGGVIACILYMLLSLASLLLVSPVFAQTTPVAPGVRLEAGVEKEDVDGDLKSAMDIYQKIASDPSGPRDVRAKALLRLAGCDEKLGHQAKQIYEQIVHDFADQPAAAEARQRLALIKRQEHPAPPPRTMNVHKIEWSRLGGVSPTNTDGIRAVYQTPEGDIYLGEVDGPTEHLIFKANGDVNDRPGWQSTRDFSMIALFLLAGANRPATVVVIKADGSGYRELLEDDKSGDVLGGNVSVSASWSWDDSSLLIAAYSWQRKSSRLWMVSALDGQRRELAHAEDGYISKVVFSPDGRFVAFEVLPPFNQSSGMCRIYIVKTDGRESHLVYESSHWQDGNLFYALKDWTADGRFLLIKDFQFQDSALFLLPMNDGKAAGIREMIHLGNFFDASTTASGAIVYQDWTTKPLEGDVFVTLLDTQGHVSEWRRLELRGKRFPNSYPWPSFSPDGSAIVYSAPGAGTDKTDVVLRELASGKERTLYTSGAKETPTCQFASRLRKIYCASWNNHDKTNLFSVSVETCALERISSVEGPRFAVYMSENDMSMYFLNHIGQSAGGLLRWDMATQKEVTLATRSSVSEVYVPSVDERWLVRVSLMSRIDVRPMSGGEWRPLVSNANGLWTQTIISPNGKSVVYHTIDLAGRNALFSVPIAGGPPERLGDFPCDFLEASCT